MKYRSLDQIAAEAEVHPAAELSRRERLERWAEALERCGTPRLRAIPDIEYGPKWEREARRADGSPISVAFADPVLRGAGLKGDTIGDAVEFFELSFGQLHRLACVCCHGRTIDTMSMTGELRRLARRDGAASLAVPVAGLAAGSALLAAAAMAAGLL
jgi:hypothetical protein